MKKYIKSSMLITILILVQPNLASGDASNSDIIRAIDKMKSSIASDLKGSYDSSVVKQLDTNNKQTTLLFDTTFKGTFDAAGKPIKLSTLGLYINNFYSWFALKWFDDVKTLDFSEKIKQNKEAIEKLQARNIGYNSEKSIPAKIADQKALLAQPFEDSANNFNPANLGVSKKDNPYGSLSDKAPLAKNAPTIADLIGPDGYSSKEDIDKAKLFINYVMNTVPTPKNIRIPEKSEAVNNKVTIYLPYGSEDKPYTTTTVSTRSRGASTPFSSSGDSDYDKMKKFLEQNHRFQTLKTKMRANITLRTLYLEALMQAYQNRMVDPKKPDGQSLAEQEKALALKGLDKDYYEKLKNQSIADVNLETLKAIKTLTYFMWKIHRDNELNALMIGASGLRLATSDLQDESEYIKPVGTLIKNRCWDIDEKSSKKRRNACKNPMTAGFKPHVEDD